MRIALLILTPALSIPMFMALFGAGSLILVVGAETSIDAGRNTVLSGLVLSFGWLLGMAFALRYPLASVVFYGLAGVLALLLAPTVLVLVFAIVSFGFAALAYAGSSELVRDLYDVEARHDELLEAIAALAPQPASSEGVEPDPATMAPATWEIR
jgi:hypothetical protein